MEGRKHGQGYFRWADQSTYTGEFQENNIEGYGKFFVFLFAILIFMKKMRNKRL